ncbi:MAG: TolC family protein [Bacteroidota bacterium]|nr:TolC family protein [Bacteroidota bacterium]
MKTVFATIIFLLVVIFANAQHTLTLKQAIETGIANNLDVNQSDLLMQKADIALKQSKLNMLPNLNASANHGTNQGRSIDPFSNAFINQNVDYASYSASSNILLFNGSSLTNRIRGNRLGYEASQMELQQAKDNLTINIILAYLGILSAEDILETSRNLSMVTEKQVERLGILNQSGAISPSQYFDLKGQLANDQIAIVDNQAALDNAKLTLSQLLNIPYDKNMDVERLPESSFDIEYEAAPDKIYQTALQQFAQVKAVHLRTESAKKIIRSVQGELYPTLSLNGNINTNYSSAATQSLLVNSVDIPSTDYVVINGSQIPVITKQSNFDTKKITYGSQIKNNKFTTVNLGLSIPLFNAGIVKSRIKLAKIDLKNDELIEQNTKTQLQQSIERAYVNFTSTSEKYKILLDQVKSFQESFRAAEILFNSGATTSVDYLIAKNNLDRTNTNLIISKYDFMLRSKVLDYYEGKALW